VSEVWWKITEEMTNMKKYLNLIVLSITLFSFHVQSEETKTTLVCSGQYFNFPQNIRDVDIKSSVIQILKSTVKVGILGFSYSSSELSDYKLISTTDSTVTFRYSKDEKKIYLGTLNRYSGEIGLTQIDSSNPNQIEQMFTGKCLPSKKIF
jgi:hypothetical protein